MTLNEALEFHQREKLPYSYTLFQPYSPTFFRFLAEARKQEFFSEDDKEVFKETDLGLFDYCEGKYVPLDLPILCEAKSEYQGQKVELNKPKRGGDKKFYVYTRNPQTKKIVKVSFGAADGGGSLKVKFNDPKKRKNFASRHDCANKTDKTKASYWSCRLPRYAAKLGMSVNNPGGYW